MVKEHNAIAAKLASSYPTMTDQQLFDKARMINAAVMAKIHTIEWTPAILPNHNLAAGMYTNWQVCAPRKVNPGRQCHPCLAKMFM